MLPRIQALVVTINKVNSDFYESSLLPVDELKEFSLRSLECSWDLDELKTILHRTPKVEKLSLKILSLYDSRLGAGDEFFSLLSSLPLKVFNYILFFYRDYSIGPRIIISTWQQHSQESIRLESDNTNASILYT